LGLVNAEKSRDRLDLHDNQIIDDENMTVMRSKPRSGVESRANACVLLQKSQFPLSSGNAK
jgi:hypothetical protein